MIVVVEVVVVMLVVVVAVAVGYFGSNSVPPISATTEVDIMD